MTGQLVSTVAGKCCRDTANYCVVVFAERTAGEEAVFRGSATEALDKAEERFIEAADTIQAEDIEFNPSRGSPVEVFLVFLGDGPVKACAPITILGVCDGDIAHVIPVTRVARQASNERVRALSPLRRFSGRTIEHWSLSEANVTNGGKPGRQADCLGAFDDD
jgi:hypothetical protein